MHHDIWITSYGAGEMRIDGYGQRIVPQITWLRLALAAEVTKEEEKYKERD